MSRKMTKSEAGKLGHLASKEKQLVDYQERVTIYNKNPLLCRQCQNPLTHDDKNRKKKFCNKSCSATYNNLQRQKRLKEKKKKPCKQCGNPTFEKNQFCCLQCSADYRWIFQILPKVINGNGNNKTIKRYLIEKHGHVCSTCKNMEWNDQPIPLEVEHIDGNSENNSLDNVVMICPNCHAQTPTYKGKNKGKGRWKRRQRYVNGLSY